MIGMMQSWLCLGYRDGVQKRPGQRKHDQPEHAWKLHMIQQGTSAHDGDDETNGSPYSDPAIAFRIFPKMLKSQRFNQRKRCRPEKGQDSHCHQNRFETADMEEGRRRHQRDQASQANDRYPRHEAVRQT